MTIESIQRDSGGITLLQLDKSLTLAQRFGIVPEDTVAAAELKKLHTKLLSTLSDSVSGVVLDPLYGYYALPAKATRCGTVFCLDTPSVERDPLSLPPLIPHWGVEHVRNNYGLAKLELYYNPYEPEASKKKALVAEIADYARHLGVVFLLELLMYEHGAAGEHSFDELQIFAVQEFRSVCDVLALDYPQSPLAAATITAELDIPWLLTERAETYDAFKAALRVSVESGARGFMASEIFWQSTEWWGGKKLLPEILRSELETTVRDRVIELSRIVDELHQEDK